ncbi:Hypothetical predicted protein [Paramuricea clavata]|uniref:Uncharacterized protein n=1 Tax=Paramuricea clavata TaxID=317549 RepID=A0A6S7FDV4_PARCT|nr:Hypothetical predicted protein [Paramuricea clavata]
MLVLSFYIIVVLAWLSAATPTENIPIVAIEPNHLYCNQELSNGQSAHYYLTKLQINTGYEFRISYPAVIPTDFIIKDLNKTTATGRKLLNVEKFVFWTDMQEEKHFEVTAFRTGVAVKSSLNDLPVLYDVVVEQLYGGVSIDIWKLVLFASVTIFLALKFCRQPFINYINAENEKLE